MGKPQIKGKLTRFLTSTDTQLSTKNVLGLGFLAGVIGFVFSTDQHHGHSGNILDHLFPVAEAGHTSSLINSGTQGYHSSHSNHTSSGSGSGSGYSSGSGSGGYTYSYSNGYSYSSVYTSSSGYTTYSTSSGTGSGSGSATGYSS